MQRKARKLTRIIFRIFLLAFFTSLEQLTTTNLTAYATSAFKTHSLIATVLVVQGVVNGKVQEHDL